MRKGILAAVLAVLTLGLAAPAFPEQGQSIELTSLSEVEVVVTNEKGEKELKRVDADKARVLPGDEVFFTLSYSNTGASPADNVVITNPVPEHMVLKPLTAFGEDAEVTFSIDGGKSFGKMEEILVIEKDGKKRPPKPEEYTHVRWGFVKALGAGAKGTVGFTATVE
jgi:uncharacterized repeat protein (TIGR01451 family)